MEPFNPKNNPNAPDEGEESYSFIEEHIKRRPLNRRVFFAHLFRLVFSAVIFGGVAGFVFLLVTGGPLSDRNNQNPLLTEAPTEPGSLESLSATPVLSTSDSSEAEPLSVSDTESALSATPDESLSLSDTENALSATPDSSQSITVSSGSDSSITDSSKTDSSKTDSSKTESMAKGGRKYSTTPTPTPTLEELEDAALRNYASFQSALRRISREALEHLAVITSTLDSEEGLFGRTGEILETSGLLLGKDSHRIFVLADHLPEGESHRVTFANKDSAPARIYGSDPTTGLAVLCVSLRDVTPATRKTLAPAELGNSYSLKTGDIVLAVGAPLGAQGEALHGSIISTERTVSMPDREYQLLVTDMHPEKDAAGFLVDTKGSVVGIFADRFFGEGVRALTAIPISRVKTLLTKLMSREKLVSFGIMGRDISDEEALSLDIPAGIYVLHAAADSPALEAGIRMGDIITGINGKEVDSLLLLEEELSRHEPGDSLAVTLMRPDGDSYVEVSCRVTLEALS